MIFETMVNNEIVSSASEFELLWKRRYDSDAFEKLILIIKSLLNSVLISYENQRYIIPILVDNLKEDVAFANILFIQMVNSKLDGLKYKNFKNIKPFEPVDNSDLNADSLANYVKVLGRRPRIADINDSLKGSLTEYEKKKIISFLSFTCSVFNNKLKWDESFIETLGLVLCIGHSAVYDESSQWEFYKIWTTVIRHIVLNGNNQSSRDMTEEMIFSGYVDNKPDYAFLGAAKSYIELKDTVYALLFLYLVIEQVETRQEIHEEIAFEICWLFVRIMREAKYYNEGILESLEYYISSLNLDFWDKNCFNHSVFSLKIFKDNSNNTLPTEIREYLDIHREKIISYGPKGVFPWYILIANLKKIFEEDAVTSLSFYYDLFGGIVGEDEGAKEKTQVIFGKNSRNLLLEKLIKLGSTLNAKDLITDLYEANLVAENLLDDAFTNNNFSDFIMAMSVKSDLTLAILEKSVPSKLIPFKLEKFNIEDIETIYDNLDGLRRFMSVEPEDMIIWFANGRNSSYCLEAYKSEFSQEEIEDWHNLDKNNIRALISSLKFESTKKDSSGSVYYISNEEHELETEEILKSISTFGLKFNCDDEPKRILICKDIDFASIPVNLIINSNTSRFISEEKPTVTIFSTEHIIANCFHSVISKPTISYWCPTYVAEEYVDLPLCILHNGISGIIESLNANINTNLLPQQPLNSNINIVCAHGGNDIDDINRIFIKGHALYKIDRIIGKGDILILFVCHSGKGRASDFTVSFKSYVKEMLLSGYKTVIAPTWSLSVDILPIWLVKFFESLKKGEYIIDAHFCANMAVKRKFPNVKAWGCVHLFGNPYLKVDL